jgi:hypothetical protein
MIEKLPAVVNVYGKLASPSARVEVPRILVPCLNVIVPVGVVGFPDTATENVTCWFT